MNKQSTLGEILKKKGLISEEQLKMALNIQIDVKRVLGYILIRMGIIDEKQLMDALSDQYEGWFTKNSHFTSRF